MPIPRSLLSREVPTDHDLRVTGGTWPAGLRYWARLLGQTHQP